jgi:hypothetical protein
MDATWNEPNNLVYMTEQEYAADIQEAEQRGREAGYASRMDEAEQDFTVGHDKGYWRGQRDAIAAGGGIHGTDCTFLSGGSCNCHPETSPDVGEDYGAPARIDTVEYGRMRYEKGVNDERERIRKAVKALYVPGWPPTNAQVLAVIDGEGK